MAKLQVSGKVLTTVFLLAFTFRLLSLNQSLWLDEATSARVVSSYSFDEIVSKFSPYDFHPPLYYLVLKTWTNIAGTSEIALRFPSILFSLLSGWIIYLSGKKLKNEKVGLYAMIFFLFNPLVVYYSQEARMYLVVTFFISLLLYYVLRINGLKRKIRLTDIIFCNIFIALSFLTFYGSIFFIIAIYLYFLYKRDFKTVLLLMPGFLISFLITLPLLMLQLANSKETLQEAVNWINVLGKADIKNLLLIPVKFSLGRISFEPKPLYYTVSLFWTGFIFFVASKKARQYILLSSLFLLPIILGFLFSFYKPLLQYFRFLYLLPILSLLLALGSQDRAQRIRILIGFFFFSCAYLFNPAYHREDWRSLAATLQDTKAVYMVPSSSDPLFYYKKDTAVKDIRDIAKSGIPLENNITVIPYTADIFGFDYTKALEKKGFSKSQATSVRGLQVEQWTR